MISEKKLFGCPSCGDRDHMATIEKVEAYSELDDKGEFTGTTDYDGDHETVGIMCRVCGWELVEVGDRAALVKLVLEELREM